MNRITRTLVFTFDDEHAAQAFDAAVKSRSGDLPYGYRYPVPGDPIEGHHLDLILAVEYLTARSVNAWLPITSKGEATEEVAPGLGIAVQAHSPAKEGL